MVKLVPIPPEKAWGCTQQSSDGAVCDKPAKLWDGSSGFSDAGYPKFSYRGWCLDHLPPGHVHFVVPPAAQIGRYHYFNSDGSPCCAFGHLLKALGVDGWYRDGAESKLERLTGKTNAIPLMKENDKLETGEARREMLIKWLRENFPECEVK